MIFLQLRTTTFPINPGHYNTKVCREKRGRRISSDDEETNCVFCEKSSIRSPRPGRAAPSPPVLPRPLCLRPHTRSPSPSSPSNLRQRGRRIRTKKLNTNKYGDDDDTKALFSLCANAVPIDTARFPWGHFVLTPDPHDRGEMRRHFWGFSAEPSRTPPGKRGDTVRYQSILCYLFFLKR